MSRIRVVLLSEANSKFGAPVLQRLAEYPGVELVGLVTRPPGVLCEYYLDEPDPVDLAAEAAERGLTVLRPAKVNDPAAVEDIRRLRPDYLLIANYQQILRAPVLAVPAVGTVNVHPGPLPRYAGLAPFFWMAKNGERSGGTSVVWTTTEVDGGPLIAQRPVVLNGTESATRIRDLHFLASWQLLDDVLPSLIARDFPLTQQDPAQRTYFGRPKPEDRTIDFTAPTESVLRTVRACTPDPGALAVTTAGTSFRVVKAEPFEPDGNVADALPGTLRIFGRGRLAVRTGDGWLNVTSLRLEDSETAEPQLVRDLPTLLETLTVGQNTTAE